MRISDYGQAENQAAQVLLTDHRWHNNYRAKLCGTMAPAGVSSAFGLIAMPGSHPAVVGTQTEVR